MMPNLGKILKEFLLTPTDFDAGYYLVVGKSHSVTLPDEDGKQTNWSESRLGYGYGISLGASGSYGFEVEEFDVEKILNEMEKGYK